MSSGSPCGWDRELVGLLPVIDFFICNLSEAGGICGISSLGRGTALKRTVIFHKMAKLFYSWSPNTYVIVTLGGVGRNGSAVALFGEETIINADCPVSSSSSPSSNDDADPLLGSIGAGDDAFAAGFLKGVMEWMHYSCREIGSDDKEEKSGSSSIDGALSWRKAIASGYDDCNTDLTGSWTEAVMQGMNCGV